MLEKAIRSGFRNKDYIFPSGKVERVQGYEPYCLNLLLHDRKIPEDDIVVGSTNVPTIPYTNPISKKQSFYFPDVYIKSQNLIIEVKSPYTYNLELQKNQAKLKACILNNYKVELYMFGRGGVLIKYVQVELETLLCI